MILVILSVIILILLCVAAVCAAKKGRVIFLFYIGIFLCAFSAAAIVLATTLLNNVMKQELMDEDLKEYQILVEYRAMQEETGIHSYADADIEERITQYNNMVSQNKQLKGNIVVGTLFYSGCDTLEYIEQDAYQQKTYGSMIGYAIPHCVIIFLLISFCFLCKKIDDKNNNNKKVSSDNKDKNAP